MELPRSSRAAGMPPK